MNEQTIKLIEQLAEKLGTTTEHVWAILVRQAPIAATLGLLELLLDSGLAFFFLWSGRKLWLRATELDDENESDSTVIGTYITACVCFAVGFVFTLSFTFGDLFSLTTTLSGWFNPEFWALKQIIR